jgi:hypothetical protein
MGAEPDALLLEEPLAFYVPRTYEAFDGQGFLTALKAAGGWWVFRRGGNGVVWWG